VGRVAKLCWLRVCGGSTRKKKKKRETKNKEMSQGKNNIQSTDQKKNSYIDRHKYNGKKSSREDEKFRESVGKKSAFFIWRDHMEVKFFDRAQERKGVSVIGEF